MSVVLMGKRRGSPYIAGGRYLGLQDLDGNDFGISFFLSPLTLAFTPSLGTWG
jgi:hypothetical protein